MHGMVTSPGTVAVELNGVPHRHYFSVVNSQRLTVFSYTHATLRNNVTQWLTAILMLIGIICIYYFYLNIVFHEKTSYLDIFNLNLNHNYV